MTVRDDEPAFMMGMEALFGAADAAVLADPVLRHHMYITMSEGLRKVALLTLMWTG